MIDLAEYELLFLENMSPQSKRVYLAVLKEFQRFQEKRGKKLAETKALDVAVFLKSKKTTCNDKGLSHQYFAIKKFMQFLKKKKIIDGEEYELMDEFKIRVQKGDEPGKVLTKEEIEVCLSRISHPIYRFLFFVGVNFGLRREEYTKLKISDFNRKNRRIRIEGKGNKVRFIPVTSRQLSIFERFLKQRELDGIEHEYLLYSKTGRVLNRTVERYFVKLSEMSGIKFTSHDLRRTFATRLWREARLDIFVISRMMGHSSVSITERYLRPSREEIEKRYLEVAEEFF